MDSLYIPVSYTHLDVYKRQVKHTVRLSSRILRLTNKYLECNFVTLEYKIYLMINVLPHLNVFKRIIMNIYGEVSEIFKHACGLWIKLWKLVTIQSMTTLITRCV